MGEDNLAGFRKHIEMKANTNIENLFTNIQEVHVGRPTEIIH